MASVRVLLALSARVNVSGVIAESLSVPAFEVRRINCDHANHVPTVRDFPDCRIGSLLDWLWRSVTDAVCMTGEWALGYFTDAGPWAGEILNLDTPGVITVLEAPDQQHPVGTALRVGWNNLGVALWSLTVHGEDLPGPWFVVNREFVPVRWDRPNVG
jgi:hypothetical protein